MVSGAERASSSLGDRKCLDKAPFSCPMSFSHMLTHAANHSDDAPEGMPPHPAELHGCLLQDFAWAEVAAEAWLGGCSGGRAQLASHLSVSVGHVGSKGL